MENYLASVSEFFNENLGAVLLTLYGISVIGFIGFMMALGKMGPRQDD